VKTFARIVATGLLLLVSGLGLVGCVSTPNKAGAREQILGAWRLESSISLDAQHRLVPYSPDNNLIRNEVVLLPSAPADYGSEQALVGALRRGSLCRTSDRHHGSGYSNCRAG